jgi:hypothetical protein
VNGAPRAPRVVVVVRHDADRRAFRVELVQEVHDGIAALRVQAARRLVCQQNPRVPGNRPRHRHTLLLPAGELARQVIDRMRHLHPRERRHHALAALCRRQPAVQQRQLGILEHRQIPDQIEALKDKADLPIPDPRPLPSAEPPNRASLQPVLASGRQLQQPQDREQRRLPGSGRPLDRDVLAATDLEVHIGERVRLQLVAVKDLSDPR